MTNLAFTALIKSKGYNQKSLAEETGIPPGVLSHRINSRSLASLRSVAGLKWSPWICVSNTSFKLL